MKYFSLLTLHKLHPSPFKDQNTTYLEAPTSPHLLISQLLPKPISQKIPLVYFTVKYSSMGGLGVCARGVFGPCKPPKFLTSCSTFSAFSIQLLEIGPHKLLPVYFSTGKCTPLGPLLLSVFLTPWANPKQSD